MKGFTFVAVSAWLIAATGLALAQTPIPAATMTPVTPIPTPTIPVVEGIAGPTTTNSEMKARIKKQEARIKAYSRVGQLTSVQANALLANLKTIKDQLKADYAENGKKQLTSDQKVELIQMLDSSEKNIGERNGIQSFN